MLIAVEEAERRLAKAIKIGATESVALGEAAGRVLREPVRTDRPVPPYDRVMMDGIAVRAEDWSAGCRRFRPLGRVHAGEDPTSLTESESAWWVMTGAVCPEGAGVVIPREQVSTEGEWLEVALDFVPPEGGFVHWRGSDAAAGTEVLSVGQCLDGVALGVAASCGCAHLTVAKRPRVVVISTGDELVEPGEPISPHQVARSNPYALAALFSRHTGAKITLRHVADDQTSLEQAFAEARAEAEFVVCSGGVSQGDRDYVPAALRLAGFTELFHGVAQRPGKPLWVGRSAEGKLAFGLPGNPVSALVGARRYVVPALCRWLGQTAAPEEYLMLAELIRFAPPLTCFLPVRRAGTQAHPAGGRNSGDFLALRATSGFVELRAEETDFPAGYAARYLAW